MSGTARKFIYEAKGRYFFERLRQDVRYGSSVAGRSRRAFAMVCSAEAGAGGSGAELR